MVLPLIGAAIGAGATLMAARSAANSAKNTAKSNERINQQNLAARNAERMDSIAAAEKMDAWMRQTYGDQVADRQLQMARLANEREEYKGEVAGQRTEEKLGYTDALGNSTQFVPGKGWVTTAAKKTDDQIRADVREEMDEDLFRQVRDESIGWGREAMDYTRQQREAS